MKKAGKWLLAAALVVIVLAAAFFMDSGEKTPEISAAPAEETVQPTAAAPQPSETAPGGTEDIGTADAEQTPLPTPEREDAEPTPEPTAQPEKDRYHTDPVPEGKPQPVEPQESVKGEGTGVCTISISCATILDNMDVLDPEKTELVPPDGWILPVQSVTFTEGESVFDVLSRVCRENGIHMEFSNTPIYNSAYIEGIGNLYEFDTGNLSGWMYRVNGWFPNYGCSRYRVSDGDTIEWVYTCDLGYDVGGGYISGGGS